MPSVSLLAASDASHFSGWSALAPCNARAAGRAMGDRVDAREMFWEELRWDSDSSAIGKGKLDVRAGGKVCEDADMLC
jgi:hypothetical protein